MGNPIEEAAKAAKAAAKNAPPPAMRTITNLSPSAVICFEKTPVEFYFRYMVGDTRPVFEQTRAMAYGSAFDGRVKELLALRQPKVFRAADYGLLRFVQPGFHRDMELKRMCDLLARAYVEGPPGAHHKKHKPVIMEGTPALVDFDGVPVYGKVDVQSSEPRILDFKVSGSNSQAYPVVGYVDGWFFDPKDGSWERIGEHNKGFKSVIETHEDWAFQLTTYDMIRTGGPKLNRKSPIGIDQISFHPNKRIAFTHLREEIPCEFKKAVVARYKKCWAAIQGGTVLPKEYRKMPLGQLDLVRGQIKKW